MYLALLDCSVSSNILFFMSLIFENYEILGRIKNFQERIQILFLYLFLWNGEGL